MTPEEEQIFRAFIAEYERLCDLFQIKPHKHPAYVAVRKLLPPSEVPPNEIA